MSLSASDADTAIPRRRSPRARHAAWSRFELASVVRNGDGLPVPGAHEDADLIRRVAAGDRPALAALYDVHAPRLFGLVLAIVRRSTVAEDILHDVFVEVLHRAGDYDPRRGSVRAWLIVRARSRALDRVRSATARRERLTASEPERASSEPSAEERMDHATARARFEQLDEGPRRVLELAYFQGLTMREIAERLDIPVGTAKSRAAAGLRSLRSSLDASPPEGTAP